MGTLQSYDDAISARHCISKTCFLFIEIHNFHSILIDFIGSTDPTE